MYHMFIYKHIVTLYQRWSEIKEIMFENYTNIEI